MTAKPKTKTISLLPHQLQYVNSTARVCALLGGLGSGKSYSNCAFIIKMLSEMPNVPGLVAASTYSQLRDSVLQPLFDMLDSLGIPWEYNKLDGWLTVNGTKIKAASLENYNVLRGLEVGWAVIDEARECSEEAFNVVLGRVRAPGAPYHYIRLSSTPKGHDWLWRRFASEERIPGYEYIHARSTDNPHLPQDYVSSLEHSYDSKTLQQERDGLFVNSNAGLVYSFDRNKHVKTLDLDLPLKIGSDFNVNPMTSVIGSFANDFIYISSEIFLENSNTFELAKTLLKQFGPHLTIYPDASGAARKSSSQETDHQILREAGFTVDPLSANPHVIDRINCVNWLFEHNRLFISPECKFLIKDLETLTHGSNNKMLGHLTDGLGYMCWKYRPLRKPRQPSRQIILG